MADEQEKQVNAEAQKIGREAEEANVIATQVQMELDKALPALQVSEGADEGRSWEGGLGVANIC